MMTRSDYFMYRLTMPTLSMNILNYKNLEDFLNDFYEKKRRASPGWSLGVWSKKLGIFSRATLTMIMKGERSPGKELALKFAEYFKFNEKEKEHFFNLVAFQKFKAKRNVKDRVIDFITAPEPRYSVVLSEESFSRIAHWYSFAIREMTFLNGFNSSKEWILNKFIFDVEKEKVENAIDELAALNLIEVDGKEIRSSRTSFTTTDDVPSPALKKFHTENADLIKEALYQIPVENRYISSGVLSIKKDRIEDAKKLIRNFEESFYHLLEEKPGDTIISLNIQMFPLTKDDV